MPDKAPPPSGGGADRGSGGRRSGLDRLRAARGEAPPASAAESATAEDGNTRGNGATTVLDTSSALPKDDTSIADEVQAEPSSATEAETERANKPSRFGRRLARRSRADAVAGEPAADDVADEGSAGTGRRAAGSKGSGKSAAAEVPQTPAGRRQVILAVALALLVLALAIPVVAMRHRIIGQTKEQKAVTSLVDKRQEGLAAGRQFAITFFTFDYRKIDDFNKQVLAMTTGDFNKDFAGKQGQLKSTLAQVQSVATARVLAAGVSRVSGDTVDVLVVADQDVKNKASQGKTLTTRYRLSVTVQKTPKGWLVSGVSPVV
jgi:hypothetical protein